MINRLACVFALGCIVAACGGDDDDDTGGDVDGGGDLDCSSFTACGGDATGNWSFEQVCTEDGTLEGCPGGVIDYSGLAIDGSLTIDDDMTYSIATTLSGAITMTAPLSCLQEGLSCADAGGEGVTCMEVGDTCHCEQTLSGESSEVNGTWEASGSSLTMTSQEGDADSVDFCVDGDVLKFNAVDAETEFTYSLQRL